jgi:hypothetical protein
MYIKDSNILNKLLINELKNEKSTCEQTVYLHLVK